MTTVAFGDDPIDIAPGATALSPAAAITSSSDKHWKLSSTSSAPLEPTGTVTRAGLSIGERWSSLLSIIQSAGRAGLASPDLLPVPDGGLQLRWDAVPVDLELEPEPGGFLASFVCDDRRAGQQIDGDLPGQEARLELALARLAQAG